MKYLRTVLAVLALALVPAAMHAQNGCVDSPESPTAVLAFVGSAAAALAALRRRRASRR